MRSLRPCFLAMLALGIGLFLSSTQFYSFKTSIATENTGANDARLYNPKTGTDYTTRFTFVSSLTGTQPRDSIAVRNQDPTNGINVTAMTFTNPEFSVLTPRIVP